MSGKSEILYITFAGANRSEYFPVPGVEMVIFHLRKIRGGMPTTLARGFWLKLFFFRYSRLFSLNSIRDLTLQIAKHSHKWYFTCCKKQAAEFNPEDGWSGDRMNQTSTINVTKCSLAELHSLKTFLMQDFLTGKVEVTLNKKEAAFR